jgi:hypothetical protein
MMKSVSLRAFGTLGFILLVLTVGVLAVPAAWAVDPDRPPVLSCPRVVPYNQNDLTFYRFTVRYTSPDHSLPSVIQVLIDGQPTALTTKSKKAGYDAVYESAKLRLENGHHKYAFVCEDGRGLKNRSPRYGEWDGPYVARSWRKTYNTYPVLSDGHLVQGEVGDIETYFTFMVSFSDYDSTPPREVKVVIDGHPKLMQFHKGSPVNGTYIYNCYLDTPPHAYYFSAVDAGGAVVTYPTEGFLSGPAISDIPNTNPELSEGRVDPIIGDYCEPYTFQVRYWDAEKDPPAIIQVYIDGFPHNMKLWQGKRHDGVYRCKTKLVVSAMHTFYFRAEDGRGGEATEPVQGIVHGPVVVNQ